MVKTMTAADTKANCVGFCSSYGFHDLITADSHYRGPFQEGCSSPADIVHMDQASCT